ncbi:hypothetical protein KM043_000884 [Ampulex compressa]|nr:hypothetical protein KM043_000884 [Ampulex compressa]
MLGSVSRSVVLPPSGPKHRRHRLPALIGVLIQGAAEIPYSVSGIPPEIGLSPPRNFRWGGERFDGRAETGEKRRFEGSMLIRSKPFRESVGPFKSFKPGGYDRKMR